MGHHTLDPHYNLTRDIGFLLGDVEISASQVTILSKMVEGILTRHPHVTELACVQELLSGLQTKLKVVEDGMNAAQSANGDFGPDGELDEELDGEDLGHGQDGDRTADLIAAQDHTEWLNQKFAMEGK